MSIFDLDTDSAMMSRHDPKQIRARQFARTRKGFDPDQVRAFLDEVATQMEQLQSELRLAQEEGEAASRRAGPDPYTQLGAHVAEIAGLANACERHAGLVEHLPGPIEVGADDHDVIDADRAVGVRTGVGVGRHADRRHRARRRDLGARL